MYFQMYFFEHYTPNCNHNKVQKTCILIKDDRDLEVLFGVFICIILQLQVE